MPSDFTLDNFYGIMENRNAVKTLNRDGHIWSQFQQKDRFWKLQISYWETISPLTFNHTRILDCYLASGKKPITKDIV